MRKNIKRIYEKAAQAIGNGAPSYVTVKRLSASGALDNMDDSQAVDYLRGRYSQAQPEQLKVNKPADLQDGPGLGALVEHLTRELAASKEETRLAQAAADRAIAEMKNAANQLNAVKSTMMSKYDAVCSQQLQAIESLKSQLKDSQQHSSLAMEIGRMRSQVQNLIEKLSLASDT